MPAFMDENFLLRGDTAQRLYHEYAEGLPIVDYHCHVSPAEIANNRRFENISQLWLEGDHYKWRLMRACGVDEAYITGKESGDWEKFEQFARVLPRAVGNPVYHWAHLELRRYFGCDTPLGADTAAEVWEACNSRLARQPLDAFSILRQSNVRLVCTTDDPADDLAFHRRLRDEQGLDVTVLPGFRPDRALHLEKPGYAEYIAKLAAAGGKAIEGYDDLCAVLAARIDYFDALGCRACDHGLDAVPFRRCAQPDAVFRKALAGAALSVEEREGFKTELLLFLGRLYAQKGWVMQLHYGANRAVNAKMTARLGPDTGFDCIAAGDCSRELGALLSALDIENALSKTVLYSLNPEDNAMLASLAGCFGEEGVNGKVQHGAAWWFSDSLEGMERQMRNLASMGVLGNFIGMLTDSRSFLSYTRHEYFRRLLCSMLGNWADNGEYPMDMAALGALVRDIAYNNCVGYFGLEL